MAYVYKILRTDSSEETRERNKSALGPRTLGIEVTQPSLIKECGLGNLDPQHRSDRDSSAIEQALTWPLPPDLTTLVTLRLDKDALGAMAVFMLRQQGKGHKIDKMLVSWVGALDRMPYRHAREKYPELADQFTSEITDAMNYVVYHKDWHLPRKVMDMAKILAGETSNEEISRMAALRDRPVNDVIDFDVEMYGNVAYIKAPRQYGQAREFGNKAYPVAVIFDPERTTESGGTFRKGGV